MKRFMFATRWRWVAGVALALPRFRGGKKVPPQLTRMAAEDLIGSVFPDQLACAENLVGEREVPDHPLVNQTISDCLNEAMRRRNNTSGFGDQPHEIGHLALAAGKPLCGEVRLRFALPDQLRSTTGLLKWCAGHHLGKSAVPLTM